ncbi:hypothetical protein JKF63_06052 [Porcisia hertigi]|uniref:C3H1-type domain-containing protein n=1 Tax=Porcisia hertigi TaxID=2761500 RepID=A0A836LEG3_9TRYP|nr:hypothetical protein JKF63_06052 [Porcisia hertigi]
MPKANKHAEVKPSKYKTSLCQFFSKGEECPYAGRCAFAHGEHELQTEVKNVELLKATGLQRLDGAPVEKVAMLESHTSSSNSLTDNVTSDSQGLSGLSTPSPLTARPRRRTVMVSLPKHNTRSEVYQSPYSAIQSYSSYSEYSRSECGDATQPPQQPSSHVPSRGSSYVSLYNMKNMHDNQFCDCRFSATCSQGQPSKYRHNPYDMTGRIAQCA